ncbi:hypothetical protein R1sor_009261 [Riccia sorocarpa]|uniref:Uncharacterized protein n=1 Tax=Riccia sorocarpa TaxID=122646 RepID=A0ABD3HY49_9MARC
MGEGEHYFRQSKNPELNLKRGIHCFQAQHQISNHIEEVNKVISELGECSRDGIARPEAEDWGVGISWNMIAQEMEEMEVLANNAEGTDGHIQVIELYMENAASKVGRLRKTAVLLQTLESSPSRDRVVSWIRETMVSKQNVGISQVKALSRKEFLIVFASEADKRRVLGHPPSFLDGKVVRFFEWTGRNLVKQSAHLRAAWVELKGVPPFLEDHAIRMLNALGSVIQHTVDKQGES